MMKIYNKGGFAFGLVFLALGLLRLVGLVFMPEETMSDNLMELAIGVASLMIGLPCILRALSKEASRAGRISKNDERNQYIQMKSLAQTMNVFTGIVIVCWFVSMVGYFVTNNIIWGTIFVVLLCQMAILMIIGVASMLYYEHRE